MNKVANTLALMATAGAAMASDVLITPPVAVDGYIRGAVTVLGAVVAAVVLGYFGFFVVKKALGWSRKIG